MRETFSDHHKYLPDMKPDKKVEMNGKKAQKFRNQGGDRKSISSKLKEHALFNTI